MAKSLLVEGWSPGAAVTLRIAVGALILAPFALWEMRGGAVVRYRCRVGHAFTEDALLAQQMHAGVEYVFYDVLSLRGGYKFFYDSDGLTLGGGLNYGVGDLGLAIDYSFGSMGTYLGNVQRVSLGVSIR